jgi:hypothetical protein
MHTHGYVELFDPDLGALELGCDPYVVTSLQIGSPAVRENTRDRALGDGEFDDSHYLGARAITVGLRLKASGHHHHGGVGGCDGQDMQSLIDQVTPYMSPRRRPTLTYTVSSPKHPSIALAFKVPSGEILAGLAGESSPVTCETIRPSADAEEGRTYDLLYDRTYPPSDPIGSRTITNVGTIDTHWRLTIYGPVTDPSFTVNGTEIIFDRDGGLDLLLGQNLVIDTRARTALFDDNPLDSRYNKMNYDEWSWHDVLLRPGSNIVRFNGTGIDSQTSATLCWIPTYG